MNSIKDFYINRTEKGSCELNKIKRKLNLISILRLLSFVFFIFLPIKTYQADVFFALISAILFLVIFLYLVRLHGRVKTKKLYTQNLLEIYKNELLSLDHVFSQFEGGEEFIDPSHINSYDLDLFGKGSLFQFLNRTFIKSGKNKLAGSLLNPLEDPLKIRQRQETVKELAARTDWRHSFSAKGKIYIEDENFKSIIDVWEEEKYILKSGKIIKPLLIILPLLSVLTLLIWIFGGISVFFLFSCIIQLAFWLYERKKTSLIYTKFGKRQQILSLYAYMIEMIESSDWKSTESIEMVKRLKVNKATSKEIFRLKKITSLYDNRNNFLVGFLLNMIFMWDLMFSYFLLRWNEKNKGNYKIWDNTIAFYDAMNSFANFNFNHPEYIYPVLSDNKFEINTQSLGHPLINSQKRIGNDFIINDKNFITIITGANMAGKSTFLRTVGVNLILAMNGAPVCASSFKFSPVELFSNMRTTDSLFSDESYFFAELKRLKAILDEINKGRNILIILDEILKGTNSEDKLKGSQKLIKKLIELKTPTIIATHDIKLTELENQYSGIIRNLCFEIEIKDEEMHFDYTIREGVTKTMNATFLMKKMGIIE
ncbi:MAG: hypothetical protein KA807_08800 [Prolixibacteraceae bacterium]|nr:hypothetical protein [Prolixibacteraceae bacterium]